MFSAILRLFFVILGPIVFLTLFIKNMRRVEVSVSDDYKVVFKSMGWGGLIGFLSVTIFTFLYFYIIEQADFAIAVTLALVFGLVGGIMIGIGVGMIAGHIIRAYRNKDTSPK